MGRRSQGNVFEWYEDFNMALTTTSIRKESLCYARVFLTNRRKAKNRNGIYSDPNVKMASWIGKSKSRLFDLILSPV